MNDAGSFCGATAVKNVLYLAGLVVGVIRIAVPLILIVVGMIDLVKAITSQDDKQIKSATTLLVKRVVIAIAVFLIPTIVGLVMGVISEDDYQSCVHCVTNVWGGGCGWSKE